jgi:hypothetical protein
LVYLPHRTGYTRVNSPLIEESVMDNIADLVTGRTSTASRRTARR